MAPGSELARMIRALEETLGRAVEAARGGNGNCASELIQRHVYRDAVQPHIIDQGQKFKRWSASRVSEAGESGVISGLDLRPVLESSVNLGSGREVRRFNQET